MRAGTTLPLVNQDKGGGVIGISGLLAAVLTLLCGMAFAQPAVEFESATPDVNVTFPSELDLYMIPATAHQVCTTTRDRGYGEIETGCRMRSVLVRREDPRLHGLCIPRYGHRVCY